MTREEAIKRLEDTFEAWEGWVRKCPQDAPASLLNKALDMAISALREQEERSKGCEFCKGAKYIYGELSASGHVDADHDFVHEQYGDLPICPMCGRRLEDT
jgi:hypothetical protein